MTQLQQITDNFQPAFNAGKASQGTFLTNMTSIIQGLDVTAGKIGGKLDASSRAHDRINDEYQKLVEKQRRYFKAVKEFQEECDRNEKLTEAAEKQKA